MKGRNSLVTGTWNVRTLVENCGDEHIRRTRPTAKPTGSEHSVDRKLDLLVGELGRYGVSVAGIQETRWFGSDVWPAGDGPLSCTLADLFLAIVPRPLEMKEWELCWMRGLQEHGGMQVKCGKL